MTEPRDDISLSPGDVVPLDHGERKALQLYVPRLYHNTYGKVLSNTVSLIVSIQEEVIIKSGGDNIRKEAKTLRFLSQRTSIPLPKVLGVYTDENSSVLLVMQFIKGQTLRDAWPDLTEAGKERVAADLKRYVDEMRLIAGTCIGSLDNEPLPQGNPILNDSRCGPFENEDQFNEALLGSFDDHLRYYTPVARQMLKEKSDHKILFAHGDLQMKNIMVHHGRISAIVDWELAGFYPEYWDFACAWLVLPWYDAKSNDWPVYLQRYLDPYPVEAATLSIISSCVLYGEI